jgi:hypothetical protein
MITPKKLESNRRNSRKSTGPKSARGKSASRLNALRLGIFATSRLLPGEDEAVYKKLSDEFVVECPPIGPIQRILTDQLLGAYWRLLRLERAERAFFMEIKASQLTCFLRSLSEEELDANSNIAGQYYVKIYEDEGSVLLDDFLTTSGTFNVSGTATDYQRVTLVTDSDPSDLYHGTAEFRLDLYNASTNALVQTWRPGNDPNLGNVLTELSSEDQAFAPYFYDARITNRIDGDGDS